MSLEHNRQIKCEECGKVFDVTIYESINVTLNPELKEKVIHGDIYCFECPYCHHQHYIQYPFLYHDMEHKFMINQGSFGLLMNYYEEMKGSKINIDFPRFMDGYVNIGVTSYRDLCSKIAILEKGLDYRVATLCQIGLQMHISRLANEKEQEKVTGSFFIIDENGKLTLLVELQSLKDKNKARHFPIEVEGEIYNDIKEKDGNKLNDVYPYIFDEEQAIKYFITKPEKIDELKKEQFDIVLVYNENDDYFVAFVPKFNEGKFKEKDVVIVMKDMEIAKMRIKKILKMNMFEMPFILDSIPVVVRSVENVFLETTGNPNDELDNKALRKMLLKYQKENKNKLDEDLLQESNVITVLQTINNMEPEEMAKLKVGDTIDGSMIKMDFKAVNYKGRPFLAIYLEQSDVKDKYASKAIYNFDTLARIVLNSPNHFAGIMINPDTDMILVSMASLLEYKCSKVFGHAGKMRKLLITMTEREIDYVGKDLYELVFKLYFEDKDLVTISKELDATEDELRKKFCQATRLFSHIIWDNY